MAIDPELAAELKEMEGSDVDVLVTLQDDLARCILTHLKARGMTQKELAKEAGLTEKQVSWMVNSSGNFEMETIAKVLAGLDLMPIFDAVPHAQYRSRGAFAASGSYASSAFNTTSGFQTATESAPLVASVSSGEDPANSGYHLVGRDGFEPRKSHKGTAFQGIAA